MTRFGELHRIESGHPVLSSKGIELVGAAEPLAPESERGGTNVAVRQIGPSPSAELLALGSLLHTAHATAREVLHLIEADDLDQVHARPILAAIRHLVDTGRPHHGQAVGDELQRTGSLGGESGYLTAQLLGSAITCGAASNNLAPRSYVTRVVADAYRRRLAIGGAALAEAAEVMAEDDLLPLLVELGTAARNHNRRLANLRRQEVTTQ